MLLHTNEFKEWWWGFDFKEGWRDRFCLPGGKFCLPGKKKPFTGTIEICSDINPFNLKPVLNHRMNFKDGEYHGVTEEFHENGQLKERYHYKNDQRHGVCEEFYESGNLRLGECYENGRLI